MYLFIKKETISKFASCCHWNNEIGSIYVVKCPYFYSTKICSKFIRRLCT